MQKPFDPKLVTMEGLSGVDPSVITAIANAVGNISTTAINAAAAKKAFERQKIILDKQQAQLNALKNTGAVSPAYFSPANKIDYKPWLIGGGILLAAYLLMR